MLVVRFSLCSRLILEPFSFSSSHLYLPWDMTWTWNGLCRLGPKVRTAPQPYSLPLEESVPHFTSPPPRTELVFRTMFSVCWIEGWNPSFKWDCRGFPTTVLHLSYIHTHTLFLFTQIWKVLSFWASDCWLVVILMAIKWWHVASNDGKQFTTQVFL